MIPRQVKKNGKAEGMMKTKYEVCNTRVCVEISKQFVAA
jgi:hypothetical protein